MQNHLALYRHAAVRANLLDLAGLAQRLMLAHAIAGSSLWRVEAETQRADIDVIADSVAASPAQARVAAEHADISKRLGFEDGGVIQDCYHDEHNALADVFAKLIAVSYERVIRIQTFIMAETRQAATGMVEFLGQMMKTDMTDTWSPDETFFDLLRDKQVIKTMVAEVAGDEAAAQNITATAKVQKSIITDCLSGTRKAKVKNWTPRYLAFPMQSYTGRGGLAAMDAARELTEHFACK